MMKTFFKRFLGLTLIVVALAGMIFGPVGIYGIWQVRTSMLLSFYETTQLITETLDSAAAGLVIVDQSLGTATDSVDTAAQVTTSMALTMKDINVLAESFDQFMKSGIAGFLVPNKDELGDTSDNLANMQTELSNIVTDMNDINLTLQEAQLVVSDYQIAIDAIQAQILDIQINGPKWITTLTWVLTIGLAWLTLAQFGLLLQGLEYFRKPKDG
jgi:hypothetical protein